MARDKSTRRNNFAARQRRIAARARSMMALAGIPTRPVRTDATARGDHQSPVLKAPDSDGDVKNPQLQFTGRPWEAS